ncbi:MAG TPA: hypothetical protein DDW49_11670 [Deltaproteobacteria bacterium]|nr:MAG: hypothetical protein A2048_05320 [Deltaproteobacteria bacterium GWA2_45_12]HBF14026.1 hypothetical protein [Deltaproteobacteria bacterium]
MKIIIFLLVFFMMGLSAQAQEIQVKKISVGKEFFEQPNAQADQWSQVPESRVTLLPQNITTPSLLAPTINLVQIKALHNGKWMAIRVEWPDTTDDHQVTTDQASDAIAVQFPLKEGDKTSPFMGSKDAPVGIMQWKALWQHDIDKGYQKVTDIYPNTFYETYRFGIKAAEEAGNSVSRQQRKSPVEEYVAGGFGTLTVQPHQDALASGSWLNGKWVVVFARPLKNSDKNDPRFSAGDKSVIAFAVWEGGHKNVGARKNYAMWMPIVFEKK